MLRFDQNKHVGLVRQLTYKVRAPDLINQSRAFKAECKYHRQWALFVVQTMCANALYLDTISQM